MLLYRPANGGTASQPKTETNVATTAPTQEMQDWEKEAAKLKEQLEKEQQARRNLEQRVQELEQQLGPTTAT